MKVVVLQEVEVVQVVVDDEDVDENNDKDDSDSDIDEDDGHVEIAVQESSRIDVVELGTDEGKAENRGKMMVRCSKEILTAKMTISKRMPLKSLMPMSLFER